MTDLRELLVHADPLAEEGGLSDTDAQTMRRRVLAARVQHPAGSLVWHSVLAALPLAAVFVLGMVLQRALTPPPAAADVAGSRVTAGPRQIYFQTAGGTRVFWTLTSESTEARR
jgi:hypothetical protein